MSRGDARTRGTCASTTPTPAKAKKVRCSTIICSTKSSTIIKPSKSRSKIQTFPLRRLSASARTVTAQINLKFNCRFRFYELWRKKIKTLLIFFIESKPISAELIHLKKCLFLRVKMEDFLSAQIKLCQKELEVNAFRLIWLKMIIMLEKVCLAKKSVPRSGAFASAPPHF